MSQNKMTRFSNSQTDKYFSQKKKHSIHITCFEMEINNKLPCSSIPGHWCNSILVLDRDFIAKKYCSFKDKFFFNNL